MPLRLFPLCIVTVVMLCINNLLASKPPLPQGVPSQARFFTKNSVWILDNKETKERKVWYEKGILKAKGTFSKGLRKGKWYFYYPKGLKKAVGYFHKNKKIGKWKLYNAKEGGYLEAEGLFKKNQRSGRWKLYYPQKKLSATGYYTHSLRTGLWQGYYGNGKLFYQGYYKAGRYHGKWIYYYKTGELYQKGQYKNGLRMGSWKICVYSQGPCSHEFYHKRKVPPAGSVHLGAKKKHYKKRFPYTR